MGRFGNTPGLAKGWAGPVRMDGAEAWWSGEGVKPGKMGAQGPRVSARVPHPDL